MLRKGKSLSQFIVALLVLILVKPVLGVPSQSPTLRYLNERDKAIANLNGRNDPDVNEEKILLDLQKQLINIIGPVKLKGSWKKGKINLHTLRHDSEYGALDGILYTSSDEKTEVIISTPDLLRRYLHDTHRVEPKIASSHQTGFHQQPFLYMGSMCGGSLCL